MHELIDMDAGTHFTGKIFVTPHALERCVEHFGIEREKAPYYVMDNLRKAALIDRIVNEEGVLTRMFAYRRIVFVVNETDDVVITVYPQHTVNSSLLTSVHSVLKKALGAARRKEIREEKRINVKSAELNVKRAEYVLRRTKTGSPKLAAMMDAEIVVIDGELGRLNRELGEIRRERTNLAKSVAVFI